MIKTKAIGMCRAIVQGWGAPARNTKEHFFIKGISLCKKWDIRPHHLHRTALHFFEGSPFSESLCNFCARMVRDKGLKPRYEEMKEVKE